MSKNWIFFRIIGALLFIVLLVAGGIALYNAGWSQGYVASTAADNSITAPAAPNAIVYPGYYHGFFGPLSHMFPIILIVLGVLIILRMIFRPYMPPGMGYMGYGHHGHMMHGPWAMKSADWRKWCEEAAQEGEKETSHKKDA